MANLISEEDANEALEAFFDLDDTFFKYPVKILVRTEKISKFNDSREVNTDTEIFDIEKALVIPDNKDTDAENRIGKNGTADFSEAVVYIYVRNLETLGLMDSSGNCKVEGEKDTMEFQGIEYDIFGVNNIAPWVGGWVMIKFQVKKAFKKV